MKKFFFSLLISSILFSCQQSEFEYSCDPEINRIVAENKSGFSQISLSELLIYDVALQKAIFRSWDAEKKRAVWIDKLNQIQNTGQFTILESNHIQKLIDHIDVSYFEENKSQDDLYSKNKFADEWINYASNELGWSEEFLALICYRLYISQNQFDAELNITQFDIEQDVVNPTPENCNCNTSADFCSYSNCTQNGCTTTTGCGWLWSDPCNGSC